VLFLHDNEVIIFIVLGQIDHDEAILVTKH
jgi:hypothetical protein